MIQRIMGAMFGIIIGMIIISIIPSNDMLFNIYFIIILVTLKGIEQYILAFTTRCAFIVLFANHHAIEIAQIRIANIIIGGLIGLFVSYFLKLYLEKIHRQQKYHYL